MCQMRIKSVPVWLREKGCMALGNFPAAGIEACDARRHAAANNFAYGSASAWLIVFVRALGA